MVYFHNTLPFNYQSNFNDWLELEHINFGSTEQYKSRQISMAVLFFVNSISLFYYPLNCSTKIHLTQTKWTLKTLYGSIKSHCGTFIRFNIVETNQMVSPGASILHYYCKDMAIVILLMLFVLLLLFDVSKHVHWNFDGLTRTFHLIYGKVIITS